MMHGDGPITMAQACGEQPYGPLTFIPGEDFDPSDPDDCEAVRAASEGDTIATLRAENARLRAALDAREADAPHAEDGSPLPCVECGQRPWGHGYCGELCRVCAGGDTIRQ